MLNKTRLLFLIILIEGYVVLATELLAIRQLIPFVGSGTETISIIISAVLLPLAIGYHVGGAAFKRQYAKAKARGKSAPSIRRILLKNIISSLGILSLGLSYAFLEVFFGLLTSVGISHRLIQTFCYSFIFLVAPVFMLGQTVPLVSNYFSRSKLSEITGRMLFFSTTGSFFGSVFSTIVLMTLFGVHNTVIFTLGLLFFLLLLLLPRLLCFELIGGIFTFAIAILLNNGSTLQSLGMVADNNYNTIFVINIPEQDAKVLQINRSSSSKVSKDPKYGFAYMRYVNDKLIAPLEFMNEPPRDILVIGAGGFTLGLDDTRNNYLFVDIDKQLKDVSENHFLPQKLTQNKRFEATSARAFVTRHDKKYDIILIDVFSNIISIPMECTTREFLLDVKKLLKPGGVVAMNVIASPTFADRFSVRFHNTFASVFPVFSRQIIGNINAYDDKQLTNLIYLYYDRPDIEDKNAYTDDKNTYSIDRR